MAIKMAESRRRGHGRERDSDKLTPINRHALHPAVLNDNNIMQPISTLLPDVKTTCPANTLRSCHATY